MVIAWNINPSTASSTTISYTFDFSLFNEYNEYIHWTSMQTANDMLESSFIWNSSSIRKVTAANDFKWIRLMFTWLVIYTISISNVFSKRRLFMTISFSGFVLFYRCRAILLYKSMSYRLTRQSIRLCQEVNNSIDETE